MNRLNTKKLAVSGLMAALVMVGTMLIQVPTPTKGYIHIGDSMVYLCGIILGPVAGGLAAGVGSLLADAFTGYAIYAPATFFIKTLDAMAVGICYNFFTSKRITWNTRIAGYLCGIIAGGTIMVAGYLAYETFLYGFPTAVLSVAANITQAAGGAVLASPLLPALKRIDKLSKG